MQPEAMPEMKRLGFVPGAGVKPQSLGTYCEVVMQERRRAWAAKVMSLKATVGVRPWLRAAYWARTTGE